MASRELRHQTWRSPRDAVQHNGGEQWRIKGAGRLTMAAMAIWVASHGGDGSTPSACDRPESTMWVHGDAGSGLRAARDRAVYYSRSLCAVTATDVTGTFT